MKKATSIMLTALLLVSMCASVFAADFRIVTETLPEGTVSEQYSAAIEVKGNAGGAVSFKLYQMIGGYNDFPSGLTLTTEGEILGIPVESGEFRFWVRATCSGEDVYKQLTLTINPGSYVEPLSITTVSIENGTAGVWYSARLEASGTTPYTFSVPESGQYASQLPAGLHISTDGYISGTPEEAGEYIVYFSVTNGNETANALISLTIEEAPEVAAQQAVITSQPTSVSCKVGENVFAAVSASSPDGGTLTYQWYQSSQPNYNSATRLEGQTAPTLSFEATTTGIFFFFVSVTNTLEDSGNCASVNSEHFALTVSEAEPTEPDEPQTVFPWWAGAAIAVLAAAVVTLSILLARSKKQYVSKHDFKF